MNEVKNNLTVKLYNGIEINSIGYGTWRVNDDDAKNMVKTAIDLGYRHIDTASIYGNEQGVGEGIKNSDIDRKKLFVTSKVWTSERGYDKTLYAFDKTLEKLNLEYLDLYLIHWPCAPHISSDYKRVNIDTWKALIKLYKDGRVRSIGVSNFLPKYLNDLMDLEYRPMVNQIEFHVGYRQEETLEFCKQNDICVEGWSPLGRGKVLSNVTLNEIALKYGKTPAQISIKWCLKNGVIPLPKSSDKNRMKSNLEVFDFELSTADFNALNSLNLGSSSGLHPDTFNR